MGIRVGRVWEEGVGGVSVVNKFREVVFLIFLFLIFWKTQIKKKLIDE